MRAVLLSVAWIAVASIAAAQPHTGGTFSVTWAANGVSYGVNTDASGSFTTMAVGSTSRYQCEMFADNQLVLVPDTTSSSILLVDPNQMAILTTFATDPALGTVARGLNYDHNGDLWLCTTSDLYRIAPTGAVTSVASIGGSHMGMDPLTGDLILLQGSSLVSLERSSLTTTTLGSGFNGRYGDLVRDPLSGDIFVPTCCGWSGYSLHVLRNGTSASSIYLADTGLAGAYGPQLDRVSAANRRIITGSHVWLTSYPNSGGMWTIDMATGMPSKLSTFNTVTIADSTILGSRNLHTTRTAPGKYTVAIDLPVNGGLSYVLAASFSGPTPASPLPDGRRIPLVFDSLTKLTVSGLSAPYVTNTVGVLNAFGRATATIDLGPLTNALRGSAIWLCVVTFDPAAPLGLSIITDPHIVKFD